MTKTEENLLRALRQLEETVHSMPAANPKPNLLPLFAEIDTLTAQLPKDTDPQLLHFLRNKSFQRARLWLERERRRAGQSTVSSS